MSEGPLTYNGRIFDDGFNSRAACPDLNVIAPGVNRMDSVIELCRKIEDLAKRDGFRVLHSGCNGDNFEFVIWSNDDDTLYRLEMERTVLGEWT